MPDETTAALPVRLDRVEARFAIADLIHQYARFVRYDEPDRVAELFAADAFFEIRDGHPGGGAFTVRHRLASPAAIAAHLAPVRGTAQPIPLIHNTIIEVEGDTGRASSVMEAQLYGTSHRIQGEYDDRFRRIAGAWYFSSRTYTIFSGASSV